MRTIARLSLVSLGLALAVSVTARADDAPPSRSAAAAPLVHKHASHIRGKTHLCEKCAAAKAAKMKAAQVAQAGGMPAGMEGAKIVGCAHSKNGVCKECRTLLEMPGQISVVGSENPFPRVDVAQAPGRSVASDASSPTKPGRSLVTSGEPEPIGVMKTNYTPSASAAPAGMPAAPGRAVVQSGSAGSAPFMSPTPESSPHIIGHLFGFSEMANDFQDWRASRGKRKREAHAAIPYGQDGTKVEELPASMVFGNGPR
jgi:hypothetical protein